MFLRLFKSLGALVVLSLALVACGGGATPSASAPTGLQAQAGENSVTVTWDMVPGVEYWLFVADNRVAPTSVEDLHPWFSLPASAVQLRVTSPYTFTGFLNVGYQMQNGTAYAVTINGRVDGKAGGPGATPVVVTPRAAGGSWTANAAIATSPNLRTMATGTSYLVAGEGGAIYTGTDGATWTQQTSGSTANINGSLYFGQYYLVGDSGTILNSLDGVTWTAATSGTTQNLYSVATNGVGQYIAVGANGTIRMSTDATTWVDVTTSGTTRDLYSVAYTAVGSINTWVAVGAGGVVVTSTDGLTWTPVATTGTTADLHSVINWYDSTLLVYKLLAVGSGGTVLSSNDASTWTAQTIAGAPALNAVVFNTQFVAVGDAGKIFTSADMLTWTAATVPAGTTADLKAVLHNNLSYLSAGSAGSTLVSK